jgi:hypothetical protein
MPVLAKPLLKQGLHSVEDSNGQVVVASPVTPARSTESNKPVYPILPVGVRIAAAVLTLIIPGSGHFLLKRPVRGTVYFLCVTAMFVFGIILQGHLFTFNNSADWLSRFFAIFDAGLGLPYLVCYWTGAFTQAVSIAPSFEYGNTFLMVAGLLNYLIMLDGFDIAAGRKA